MNDAISRSAVLKVLFENCHCDLAYYSEYEEFKAELEAIPSLNVVEVVRCKDCKHWVQSSGATEHVKCCEFAGYMVGENGYCVYGEKKEQDA